MTFKVLCLTSVTYVLLHWLLISVTVDADSDDDISPVRESLRTGLIEDLWNITTNLNVLDKKLWDKETKKILIIYDDRVDQLYGVERNTKESKPESTGISSTSVVVISIACFIGGIVFVIIVKHFRKKSTSNTANA